MNEAGVGYVPADRQRFGLVLPFPVADNIVLTSYYRAPLARGILRNDDAILAAFVLRRVVRHDPDLVKELWPGPPASLALVLRLAGQ